MVNNRKVVEMKKITIKGSSSYDFLIEPNIITNLGSILQDEIGGAKLLIVTDTNVAKLYLDLALNALKDSNFEVHTHILSPGEDAKNLDNYIYILNVLSEHDFSRSDVIIALGGGTVGDLAGFIASTYKRGMKFVQIPTTLLASVDSSIGGKSAVNLPLGKNQVGTIYNPKLVICDPTLLHSLSANALRDGHAEIIKYGILNGLEIVELLRKAVINKDYSSVISKAISIKRDYIEKDEGDCNLRQFLNLGHLVGHALEAASNYSISHGSAVAYGLIIESKCCALADLCEMSNYFEISSLVQEFGLSNEYNYSASDLLPYILHDKRIHDRKIDIITPVGIGNCVLREFPVNELSDFIRLCL